MCKTHFLETPEHFLIMNEGLYLNKCWTYTSIFIILQIYHRIVKALWSDKFSRILLFMCMMISLNQKFPYELNIDLIFGWSIARSVIRRVNSITQTFPSGLSWWTIQKFYTGYNFSKSRIILTTILCKHTMVVQQI